VDYDEIEITEDQMLDHAEQVFSMIADVLYHSKLTLAETFGH
jgi:hypothetical protein